jgi:hypothetical protein
MRDPTASGDRCDRQALKGTAPRFAIPS